MDPTATSRPTRTALAAADAIALAAFALVGVIVHDGSLTLPHLARNVVPLLSAWFLLSPPTATYARPGLRSLLANWAAAVPVAVVLRSVLAGGPWGARFVTFLAVALAFTLLFLVCGRAVVRARRFAHPRRP